MNKINSIFILAIISIAISSCNKSLSSRLVGTWNIDNDKGSLEQELMGVKQSLVYNVSNAGNIVFKDDGTGSMTETIDGKTENKTFTWNATSESVSITDDKGTYGYTVKTNEKKKQVWTYNININTNNLGIVYKLVQNGEITLSK